MTFLWNTLTGSYHTLSTARIKFIYCIPVINISLVMKKTHSKIGSIHCLLPGSKGRNWISSPTDIKHYTPKIISLRATWKLKPWSPPLNITLWLKIYYGPKPLSTGKKGVFLAFLGFFSSYVMPKIDVHYRENGNFLGPFSWRKVSKILFIRSSVKNNATP